MELGETQVFLLSTTHGAEMSGLGAFLETVQVYRDEAVVDYLWRYGRKLKERNYKPKNNHRAKWGQSLYRIEEGSGIKFADDPLPENNMRGAYRQEGEKALLRVLLEDAVQILRRFEIDPLRGLPAGPACMAAGRRRAGLAASTPQSREWREFIEVKEWVLYEGPPLVCSLPYVCSHLELHHGKLRQTLVALILKIEQARAEALESRGEARRA